MWGKVYIYLNLYDSLYMYNHKGELVPLLAESMEMDDSGTKFTFKLKSNATFHDGTPVEASDVVFSWLRITTMKTGFSYLFNDTIKNVTAIDNNTVEFELNKPFGPFLDTLTRLYIVNEDLIMENLNFEHETYNYGEKYGDFGRTYLLSKDAGSGPYKVVEISPQNYLEAEQFTDYHLPFNEKAPTSFRIIDNTEAVTVRTLLGSNDLEISDNWQTAESIEAMAKIPGVKVAEYNNLGVLQLSLNSSKAPTDDVNIRKALASLVDYDSLIESVYIGAKKSMYPCSAGLPGSGTKEPSQKYTFDIEAAKQYIENSKYADDIGNYPVELYLISSVPAYEKIALSLQAACQQAGIDLQITTGPRNSLDDRVTQPETTPNVMIFNFAPYYSDAGAVFSLHVHSSNSGKGTNALWHKDEQLDNMIADALGIVDTEERYNAYAEIESRILDNCYAIYIADVVERVAYHQDYVGWPAAEDFYTSGNTSNTSVGYHYWFRDFTIDKK